MRTSESQFSPAPWLRNRHAQTIIGRYIRPRAGVRFNRQRVTTPDGDFLDVDFAHVPGVPPPPHDAPLVLLLHGLEGSARSGYGLELYRQLALRGIWGAGLNFRSCSGEMNRGRRLYHSGETTDAGHVIDWLHQRYPARPLAAVGISLGGNVLLKYLGERGTDTPLQCACAVSVPYDLEACADELERAASRFYGWVLLRSLKRKVRLKRDEFRGVIDVPRALASRTFREFDDRVTAPVHGFRNAGDYYRRSSSGGYLGSIRRPALLVHSLDDPFMPSDVFPHAPVAHNPALFSALTPAGGHVGFVSGPSPLARGFWAERTAANFIAARLL